MARITRCFTLLAVVAAGCGREQIVREGRSAAVIRLPARPHPDLALAAEEIRTYAKRVSGADLEVRSGDASVPRGARVEIVLETAGSDSTPAEGVLHPDGYRLLSHGRRVVIRGGSPRGTLYGAYDFIERTFDVRWFMPTALGEDIVARTSIEVPELAIAHNPGFASIDGFAWSGHPGIGEWVRRQRVRVGADGVFGHNWSNILPLTPGNLAAHPTAFAEVNGRRGGSPQLCTTDPAVIQASVEAARRFFDGHKGAPLFSISPNDGDGFCECARCRALDRALGATDGSVSDRLAEYANAVIRDVVKTHPGKRLGMLAYARYTKPPRRVRPEAGYTTLVTHMPWEFCHAHAVDDPACALNRRYLEALQGWIALTPRTGVYEYYGHFLTATPWPIVHSMRRDIPLFARLKAERFVSETQAHWATQGLGFYIAARLVNDPDVDVGALLDEYFTRFFGPAAAPMRRYSDLFETAMQASTARGDGGFIWLSMFTPALLSEARRAIEDAERAVAAGDEKYRSRVRFIRSGFDYTDAFARMMDAATRRDVREVLRWSTVAEDRLRATAGSAPQAFDIPLAIDATRYWTRRALASPEPWKPERAKEGAAPTTP